MFKQLEKAMKSLVQRVSRVERALKLQSAGKRRIACKIRRRKTARKTVSVRQYKRQRGLSEGILKALGKKAPAKVNDIAGLLPSFGYKVRDERKTKLAVFQTLHRMLKSKKVERVAKGEYKLAG